MLPKKADERRHYQVLEVNQPQTYRLAPSTRYNGSLSAKITATMVNHPSQTTTPASFTSRIPSLESGARLTRPEFERRYSAMPDVKKAELIAGIVYVASPQIMLRSFICYEQVCQRVDRISTAIHSVIETKTI
ncbi:hypothetical protein WA1_13575 [Scytonema hofmannii PCC 7110]|uniref:Uncharacterized protein n=1 Tax=Scytonema hofmannii PCC 7110 TaxID=128403 RepID=A0A139XEK9_9CYAN|nr:hypothetical protein WA1_13575 [Scytonema hofmannii PCC 7110]